jgi:hypothetical protein
MTRFIKFMWGVSPGFVIFAGFDIIFGSLFLAGMLLK